MQPYLPPPARAGDLAEKPKSCKLVLGGAAAWVGVLGWVLGREGWGWKL